MKRILLLAVFFCMLSMPSLAQSKHESAYDRVMRTGTLKCGYMPWPPFFSLDPNTGILSGFNKDVADAISQMLDIKISYVQVVVGEQVQDLRSGKIDAVCGDGPWILSTIKYLDYTQPYYYTGVYVYGRAKENRFKNQTDLDKPTVTFVGLDGDTSTEFVQKNFRKAKLKTLPGSTDPSQLFLDVADGKADLVILDPTNAALFMKNNPDKIRRIFDQPVAVYGGGFSVIKGEAELFSMLNEAVKASLNTGIVDRLWPKYQFGATLIPVSKDYRLLP